MRPRQHPRALAARLRVQPCSAAGGWWRACSGRLLQRRLPSHLGGRRRLPDAPHRWVIIALRSCFATQEDKPTTRIPGLLFR